MKIAKSDIPVDKALINRLAEPLAKLMTEQGDKITGDELAQIMLDPNTVVEFPGVKITQTASVVVVRVVRVVVVSTSKGGTEFVTLMDDRPGEAA